jgi:hypothetical protein
MKDQGTRLKAKNLFPLRKGGYGDVLEVQVPRTKDKGSRLLVKIKSLLSLRTLCLLCVFAVKKK